MCGNHVFGSLFGKGMESRALLQAFMVICSLLLAAEGATHVTKVLM